MTSLCKVDRLDAILQGLRAPVIPGRLLDTYQRGVGVCWVWLSVGFSLGISGWNLYRAPVLWQEHGVRIPWPGTAWVPVWSPVPGQGMTWILIPMLLGDLLLLVDLGPPRLIAAGLLFLGVWLLAADRVLFLFHRYLIAHMTLALLLLPAHRPDADHRVSRLDCLPVIGLAIAMWGWSAVAKIAWEWPVIWGSRMRTFGPPVVDAAIAWLFDQLPYMPTIVVGSTLTALAEILVAVGLGWPRRTRPARYLGLLLCGGFALLAPLFAFSAGVLTRVAGHCVEGGRTCATWPPWRSCCSTWPPRCAPTCCRTATSPTWAAVGPGAKWPTIGPAGCKWRPTIRWQDLTPAWHAAHPDILRQLTTEPCEIAWALAWLTRTQPELVPPGRRLRLSMPPSALAPVPAACAADRPPNVRQIGRLK